jgi:hypothetical protein
MTTELKQSACFVKGLQTLNTHVHALRLSVNHQRALDDVGPELAIGMPLRETDVVSILRAFAAHFTLSHLNHL